MNERAKTGRGPFRIALCLAVALLCSYASAGDAKPQPQPKCAACAAKQKKAKKQARQEKQAGQFVTGSRIPQDPSRLGAIPSTASPVMVIGREEIDRTGRVTSRGVLATQPYFR